MFYTPAVVQQQAQQDQQNKSHASKYGQKEHSMVSAEVPCHHRTCKKDDFYWLKREVNSP